MSNTPTPAPPQHGPFGRGESDPVAKREVGTDIPQQEVLKPEHQESQAKGITDGTEGDSSTPPAGPTLVKTPTTNVLLPNVSDEPSHVGVDIPRVGKSPLDAQQHNYDVGYAKGFEHTLPVIDSVSQSGDILIITGSELQHAKGIGLTRANNGGAVSFNFQGQSQQRVPVHTHTTIHIDMSTLALPFLVDYGYLLSPLDVSVPFDCNPDLQFGTPPPVISITDVTNDGTTLTITGTGLSKSDHNWALFWLNAAQNKNSIQGNGSWNDEGEFVIHMPANVIPGGSAQNMQWAEVDTVRFVDGNNPFGAAKSNVFTVVHPPAVTVTNAYSPGPNQLVIEGTGLTDVTFMQCRTGQSNQIGDAWGNPYPGQVDSGQNRAHKNYLGNPNAILFDHPYLSGTFINNVFLETFAGLGGGGQEFDFTGVSIA